MQDVIDRAEALERRGGAIESAIVSALTKQLRWWRRAAVFGFYVGIILATLLAITIWNRVSLNNTDDINRFINNLCEADLPNIEPFCDGI